ncbi:MAG TPA: hypothetical protein VEA69_23600 [Tepidisphaeraceae bacterium]|nr:hypothetical protein [Tepidisphaeraceae bacterium]
MTREESWNVTGPTFALLRRVTALGRVVSVFRIPASMLGSQPAAVEMVAIDVCGKPPTRHVARVMADEHADPNHACACLLAQLVGINREG